MKHSDQRGSSAPGASMKQFSSNPSRQTSGLMPTDGHDAYKRATPRRASKRSRAERTSYLVATGHLDPEETEQLNGQSDGSANDGQQYFEQAPSISSPSASRYFIDASGTSEQTKPGKTPVSPRVIPNKRSNFEQSFLDDLNRTLANSPTILTNTQLQQPYEFQQENRFGVPPRRKRENNIPLYNPRGDNDHDAQTENSRGKFKQTYTEVTLPMKTSPAFEYILKDHERRNKRCCLWFVYSTLLTICLAIIIFCSVHLILRSH